MCVCVCVCVYVCVCACVRACVRVCSLLQGWDTIPVFRLITTGGPPGVVVDAIVLSTGNDRRLPFVASITWGAHRSVFFRADFTLVVKCGLEFTQSVSLMLLTLFICSKFSTEASPSVDDTNKDSLSAKDTA